jgi:hypothetical protein
MKRGLGCKHLRSGAWVLVSLLIASGPGCGASGDDTRVGSGGTLAGASAAAGTGGAGGSAGTGGSGTSAGSGGSGADSGGAGGTAGAAGAGSPPGSAGSNDDGSTRSRLERYHDTTTDPSLSFELDVVAGLEAYPSSLEYLTDLVGRVLDKPDGITFQADEVLAPFGTEHLWTFAALDEFARDHARDDAAGPVSIHVLLLDGRYDGGEESGTVLGLAWGQRYIALFQESIRAGCSGGLLGGLSAQACEIAERSVWAHEIGHVLGLVDNGLTQQTPHRDAEHGRHDVSDACLMYWAYERPEIFDVLLPRLNAGQSADLDFCENCWADLNAARL